MRLKIFSFLLLSFSIFAEPLVVKMPWSDPSVGQNFMRYPVTIQVFDSNHELLIEGALIDFEFSDFDLAPGTYTARIWTKVVSPLMVEDVSFEIKKDHETTLFTKYFRNYGPGLLQDQGLRFEEGATFLRWASEEETKFDARVADSYQLVKTYLNVKLPKDNDQTVVSRNNSFRCSGFFNHYIVNLPEADQSITINGIETAIQKTGEAVNITDLGVISIYTSGPFIYSLKHVESGKLVTVAESEAACASGSLDMLVSKIKGSRSFVLPVGLYEISIGGNRYTIEAVKDQGLIYYF